MLELEGNSEPVGETTGGETLVGADAGASEEGVVVVAAGSEGF
jgi:hypothetical protein